MSDPGRRWRLRLGHRIVFIALQALLPASAAALLWLPASGGPRPPAGAGWAALSAAGLAWLLLAHRTWHESVTLTPDLLVVRNVFRTRRLPWAAIASVRFRDKGALVVGVGESAAASGRHSSGLRLRTVVIPAVRLGTAYLSGRRTDADEAADAIAAAAGLPPPPTRREVLSPRRARVGSAAGIGLILVSAVLEPASAMWAGLVRSAGHLLSEWLALYSLVFLLIPAVLVTLDRRLGKRARGPARRGGQGPPASDGAGGQDPSLGRL